MHMSVLLRGMSWYETEIAEASEFWVEVAGKVEEESQPTG